MKRTERGYAGHFICSHDCLFHRNTLLERGKTRIVISTVGNMRRRKPDGDLELDTVGHERYYETMAFHAKREGVYWEADVSRHVSFRSEWAIRECVEKSDADADLMHEKVVAELSRRMSRGEKFKVKP